MDTSIISALFIALGIIGILVHVAKTKKASEKAKAAPKAKEKTKPKGKAKPKKRPAPEAAEVEEGGEELSSAESDTEKTVSKGTLQNLINGLKYKADPTKNKKGVEQAEAQGLLEHYRGITSTGDRANFVAKFLKLGILKMHKTLTLTSSDTDFSSTKKAQTAKLMTWLLTFDYLFVAILVGGGRGEGR